MSQDQFEVSGVIFGLRENNFTRLVGIKKPVYVKFTPHSSSKNPTKVKPGNILLFYVSGKDKSIAGYARITSVSFKLPSVVMEQFKDKIQMNQNEFDSYVRNREIKPLLVLELENVNKMDSWLSVDFPVTMGGKYLRKDEIRDLIGNTIF
jgi:hypothetical protein